MKRLVVTTFLLVLVPAGCHSNRRNGKGTQSASQPAPDRLTRQAAGRPIPGSVRPFFSRPDTVEDLFWTFRQYSSHYYGKPLDSTYHLPQFIPSPKPD